VISSDMETVETVEPGGDAARPPSGGVRAVPRAVGRSLSLRNASALWVFAVIFIIFSLWIPETFLTGSTWKTLLNDQAISAILAIGLIIPLAAGAFDLAVGTEVGLGSIFVAWLLASANVPLALAIIIAILGGALIGLAIGLLVVKAHIDSFIATLGMSSVLLALISWISSDQQLTIPSAAFQSIGTTELFGVSLPVYIMLAIALVIYYVLERTAVGRRVYATGGNIDAARLAGVRTSTVIVASLVACSAVAAAAGVLLSATLGVGDPTVGPAYLLPAFTAAFLGSTQFRGGRVNVWGTVVAIYVLATGVKGLQLAGAPTWIPDLFNGVALLIAVGMAKYQRRSGRLSAIRRLMTRTRPDKAAQASSLL
jgi:ribose transport system permease protein